MTKLKPLPCPVCGKEPKDLFVTVGDREFDKLGDLERRTQEVLKP